MPNITISDFHCPSVARHPDEEAVADAMQTLSEAVGWIDMPYPSLQAERYRRAGDAWAVIEKALEAAGYNL